MIAIAVITRDAFLGMLLGCLKIAAETQRAPTEMVRLNHETMIFDALGQPDFMDGYISIVGNAKTHPEVAILLHASMDIVALDPAWHGGTYFVNPRAGLILADRAWNIHALFSREWFEQHVGDDGLHAFRKLGVDWHAANPRDARDTWYGWRMIATHDVGDTPGFKGDTAAALATTKAQALIIGIKQDWASPPSALAFAANEIPNARHVEYDSIWAHFACCGPDPAVMQEMDAEMKAFLDSLP